MGARLEELKTCNDLIEKHGQALQVRITCFYLEKKGCGEDVHVNFLQAALCRQFF